MLHCKNFKSDDIWFLYDTDEYTERKLYLGFCPQCLKEVGELYETGKIDGKLTLTRCTGKKLTKLKEREFCNVIYTAQQSNKDKFRKPFGWVYGVNKMSKGKNKTVIRQYRKDFNGAKELIKKIKMTDNKNCS